MKSHETTQEQADQHNAFTQEGHALIEGELIIHESGQKRSPGFFLRRKLRKAIRLFEQAIKINPNGWSSMWTIGKIYQRMGDQIAAYKWFSMAHSVNPTQPDVAREAGIAALDIGMSADAVRLCYAAVKLSPDDLGLQSNLALAYLMTGDDVRADECARVAVQGNPQDGVSKAVLDFVHDVATGRKKRPARLVDAFPVR